MAVNVSGRLLAGRYRMERRIGSGGMGAVYLARDERLGRQVAIKRLPADSPEEAARRFEREARLGASLNHPNLVTIYDTDTDEDGVLIVMEYVEGRNLAGELSQGPLGPERALEVVGGIAAALDHAHDAGVVHRDVKPANVLLGDGAVKLADLGIATAAEQSEITRTGTVLGTPSYMAPEQLEGRPLGPAVDVYALATVAFECLCGCKARTGRTPIEIARKVASEPPPDLRESGVDVPPQVADALRRGMAGDPDDRPRSAGALMSELKEGLAAARTESTQAMPATRRVGPRDSRPRPRPGAAPPPRTAAPARPAPAATPPPTADRPAPTFTPYSRSSRSGRTAAVLAVAAVALVAIGLILWSVSGSDEGGQRASESTPESGSGSGSERSGSGGGSEAPAPEQPPAPAEEPSTGGDGALPPPDPADGEPPAGGYDAAKASELNDEGFALQQKKQWAASVPILARSVAAFPPDSEGHPYDFALFNLGKGLNRSGRPDEAIPYLERRLEVSSYKLGEVQRELALAEEAASQ